VQCKHAHLYRSASAPGWLTTPTVIGQPVSITGQPATPTTDTLASPSQTLVVLKIVLILFAIFPICFRAAD